VNRANRRKASYFIAYENGRTEEIRGRVKSIDGPTALIKTARGQTAVDLTLLTKTGSYEKPKRRVTRRG